MKLRQEEMSIFAWILRSCLWMKIARLRCSLHKEFPTKVDHFQLRLAYLGQIRLGETADESGATDLSCQYSQEAHLAVSGQGS